MLLAIRIVVGLTEPDRTDDGTKTKIERNRELRIDFRTPAGCSRSTVHISGLELRFQFQGNLRNDSSLIQEQVKLRQALDQFILALRPVPVAEGRILLIPHTGDDAHALPIIAHQSGAHAVLIVFLQITPKHPEQIVTGPVKTCRPLVELTKKVLIRNIIDIGAVTPRGGHKESVGHSAQPVPIVVGTQRLLIFAYPARPWNRHGILIVDAGGGEPCLLIRKFVRPIFDTERRPDLRHPATVERHIMAFINGPEIRLGIIKTTLIADAVVWRQQPGLARCLCRQYHEGAVKDSRIFYVKSRVEKLGIAVNLHDGLLGIHRPRGTGSVAGRHFCLVEGIAITPMLDDPRAAEINVRPLHENMAIRQPAGFGVQIKLGFI